MAARLDVALPEVVELGALTVRDLDPLLAEEIGVWEQRFAWDFRPSADLLRRFVQIQSLYGYALISRTSVIGYAYYVCEGRKGLIGDFYVRREFATPAHEMMLLGATVQGLMLVSGMRRIESQLMLLRAPLNQPFPFSRHLTRHDRYFMEVNREAAIALPAKTPAVRVKLLPWTERYQEEIAHLVSAAYRGHVDSEINDQYRTIPGARHFLTNIVKYPGCGNFSQHASVIAVDDNTGRVCGVCLASLVSAHSGHITQLCILPALRQARLGYELLRQSLLRLVEAGCTSVSLTVTCSNVDAIRLYESVGFRTLNTFPALVWEGF
ncbi:MAG: GNAT family N-acetyltransferase [Acidobacteriaceae bacterium]|nr:GNAT family N-acetyltransferase [Acidobacteriaceae bacterium]